MTDRRVLIACAGPQHKWNNHMGVPSHLVKDKTGEPILHRTVRQVRDLDYAAETIIVAPTTGHEKYHVTGALMTKVLNLSAGNEYWSTFPFWATEGRTVLILGDTYFEDKDIERIILGDDPGFTVYGRYGPSKRTGSPYGEIFASSWWPEDAYTIHDHMCRVHDAFNADNLRRQCGWEILYSIQGRDVSVKQKGGLCPHVVYPEYFVNIDSLTDDIDYPMDWVRHPMFGSKK